MARKFLILVLFLYASCFVQVPLAVDAQTTSTVHIDQLDPFLESFTISNPLLEDVDVGGYTATDGEGTIILPHYILGPGRSVTFASPSYEGDGDVVIYPSEGKKGNLAFANSGDELAIYDARGALLDSVCYGTSKGVDGWIGDPAVIG